MGMTREETISYLESHGMISDEVKDTCIDAIKKVKKYEALEEKLRSVYGDNNDLLEIIVNGLVKFEKAPATTPDRSVLLTDESVDKWNDYKKTMEEFDTLKEKYKESEQERNMLKLRVKELEKETGYERE